MQLTKVHATANDFLIHADLADMTRAHTPAQPPLTPAQIMRLCHRYRGVGADGYIRLTSSDCADVAMECWHGDGSRAAAFGNGARAVAAYLDARGWKDNSLRIHTPAGIITVCRARDGYRVDLGAAQLADGTAAAHEGFDTAVTITGVSGQRPGLAVSLLGPHVVVALPGDLAELPWLAHGDIQADPAQPEGTHIELVVPAGENADGEGVLDMRVIEFGVGETLSSGTGAAAAAFAVRHWAGAGAPSVWQVRQPGGLLRVEIEGTSVSVSGSSDVVADIQPYLE